MNIRVIFACISAALMFIGALWYISLIIRDRKVKPVLPSWIVMGGTLSLSFGTYWTSPNHELVSGIANAAGAVLSGVPILITVTIFHFVRGKKETFNLFQRRCLIVSGVIACYWMIQVWGLGGVGTIPNLLTQVLMIIGYAVTAEKLWYAERNSESFFTWGCIGASNIIGLGLALQKGDALSIIYSARSAVCAGFLIFLMYRLERRKNV